jgi:hypothetical protein
MKNLGKIIVTWMVLYLHVYAGLDVNVSSSDVTIGERVTLRVSVSGTTQEAPKLSSICGHNIISTSKSTTVEGVDGLFHKKDSYDYVFIPTTSCTIQPITLKVDGVDEISKPIDIHVSAMKITKNSPFVLTLQAEKKSVRVGEPFKLNVLFRQKNGNGAVDSKFSLPQMKNFWVKQESVGKKSQKDGFTTQELTYIIAAQKAGYHTIAPARIEIATRTHKKDSWGQWFSALNWHTYFSNSIEMEVLSLPQGVDVVGTFKISAIPDTLEVNASEPVNITVRISGSGNFEDIKAYKPTLKGVGIFQEEPLIGEGIKNGEYRGLWSQKIVYVPNDDTVIEPFVLTYFDLSSQSVKSIQTKPIKIHVNGASDVNETVLKIQRAPVNEAVVQESKSKEEVTLVFIVGLVLGLLGGLLLARVPFRSWFAKEEGSPSSYKNERDMLMLLLSHLDDNDAKSMVERLEKKLYEGADSSIDTKELKRLFKRFS